MVSKKVVIQNETGLHARPAAEFVKFCMQFSEKIVLKSGGKEINTKSIISILAAGITKGAEIEVEVSGENEAKVCEEVVRYIENIKE